MLALGLTASDLAREADVAVGSVENAMRREREGTVATKQAPAEAKVLATLDRIEAQQAAADLERVIVNGGEWAIIRVALSQLSPEERRRQTANILKALADEVERR